MTKHASILVLLAGLAASASPALADGPRSMSTGDNNVTGENRPHIPEPSYDYGDLPIDQNSVDTSLDIHDNREAIALTAQWLGPGPHDLAPIIAGDNSDWIEELRVEARMLGLTANHRGIVDLIGRANGNGGADLAAWFAPAGNTVYDSGGYDPRGHTVLNLWPVVQGPNGLRGEVPYTFSANMIAAFVNVTSTDPIVINAQNGIANALAVMLILEQELPIRFVGFNPAVHDPDQTLIFESVGDGTPIPGTNNAVSRMGAAPAGGGAVATQMTHNSWQNFPSMVRSLGFVLGLDWEQRHPNRDTFIQVNEENLPPAGFPVTVAPPNGINGPGIPTTFNALFGGDTGPLFWEQTLRPTNVPDADGCDFDLDSIMLISPFEYSTIGPAHTIRDQYRYVDLNGDNTVDTTPAGPDDRMFSQPLPVFFSECDIASLTVTYSNAAPWFYGADDQCPYDINRDNVQDGQDAALFLNLYNSADPSADLVPPFGQVDQDDLDAFNGDVLFPGIIPFIVQDCVGPSEPDLPDDFGWFYGKNPVCPADVDENDVQNGEDGNLFTQLWNAGNPAADLVPPFGVIDEDDFDAFFLGQAPYTVPFLTFDCVADPDVLGWYYGKNEDCPHDVDENLIQDSRDIILFQDLWEAGDFSADLVPPFGQITLEDFQAFLQGDPANGIEAFTPGFCDNGPPGPANRPGRTFPG